MIYKWVLDNIKGDKNNPPGPVKMPPKRAAKKYSPKLVPLLSLINIMELT